MTTKKKITEKDVTETIENLIVEYRKAFELIPRTINNKSCGFFANSVSDTLKDKSIKVQCKTAPEVFDVDLNIMGLPQHVFIKHGKKYYDAERPEGVKDPSELPFYQRWEKEVPKWKKEAKERKQTKLYGTPKPLSRQIEETKESIKWYEENILELKELAQKAKNDKERQLTIKDLDNEEKALMLEKKKLSELSH